MSDEEIVELYQTGLSISKLSRRSGRSPYLIAKILRLADIEIRKDNGRKLPLDIVEIRELYRSGLSTYEIAKSKNCSDETIRRLLNKANTELRTIKERNKRSAQSISKIGIACKKKWQDANYIANVAAGTSTVEYKQALAVAARKHKQRARWAQSDVGRAAISQRTTELWKNTDYYQKQSVYFQERGARIANAFKKFISNPTNKAAWKQKISKKSIANREKQPRISSKQHQLYYILRQSNIQYYEEGQQTRVGPFYVVDCIVPKQQSMKRDLVVEVQGEYWHSLANVIVRDRQKETYISKHTDYDLLHLEELDLSSWDEIVWRFSAYGLELKTLSCIINDLHIEKIDERIAKMFYSIFHYSSTIRKGATTFAAMLGNQIVAAISYTYPIRTETATKQGLHLRDIFEISRLARITNIICPNLLSWFISSTIRLLPKNIKVIVSFSDSTYGHTGGVYKAANFTLDGIVAPDYWYSSINGKYHKKTIWDNALKFRMTESEYAVKHNLIRQYGAEKTRWIRKL